MGRPANPNTPGDGFVSRKQFLETGSIASSDFAVTADQDASKKLAFDASSLPTGTTYTIKTPAVAGGVTVTMPSTTGTLVTTATETNSFSIVQPPAGTSPTASSPTDTLTLTSSDSSVTITGNSGTKSVDFKAAASLAAITFQEQTPYATQSGVFTTGSWVTRNLNTVIGTLPSFATFNATTHQFTLAAGTYVISAGAPAYTVNRHQARLQNITDATTPILGSSEFVASGGPQTQSFVDGVIVPMTKSECLERDADHAKNEVNNTVVVIPKSSETKYLKIILAIAAVVGIAVITYLRFKS